jgi:hypothetical protein
LPFNPINLITVVLDVFLSISILETQRDGYSQILGVLAPTEGREELREDFYDRYRIYRIK